jgi:hypothetical protein
MPSPAKPAPRSLLAAIIDRFNPGITLLVLLWVIAFAIRQRLTQAGAVDGLVDDALRALLYVVPFMLVGWGALIIVDKLFGLGILDRFESDD